MRISHLFTLLLGLALATTLSAQQPTEISVKKLMTVEEFQKAGLSKLSEAELTALDDWFARTALRLMSAAPSAVATPGASPRALDFSSLEGAIIVAEDGEFLGKITIRATDPQSIGNEIGRYGGTISRTSIFNEIGRYGGEISRMSPFNSITSVPPRIFKGDRFIAYLTVNTIITPRVDPRALIGWIKSNQ
ncbi:MAG: hypothetical protein QF637_04565 [Acidimicrobiales bacterium]|jgi:hypothetical protein|nr:hypothetical protein [Acidimicrobiales bacterium]